MDLGFFPDDSQKDYIGIGGGGTWVLDSGEQTVLDLGAGEGYDVLSVYLFDEDVLVESEL